MLPPLNLSYISESGNDSLFPSCYHAIFTLFYLSISFDII